MFGGHKGSVLSPLLFILELEVVDKFCYPWGMRSAGDGAKESRRVLKLD